MAGDRVGEVEEIFGYHLEQAYRYRSELGAADDRTEALARDAAAALHASAERAAARGDLLGQIRLLGRTVEIADGLERASALVDLGEALEARGEYARVIELLGRFLSSPEASAEPGLRIRASIFELISRGLMDPEVGLADGTERATELLEEAESIGDEHAITACLLALGTMWFWMGRCADAHAVSERLLPRIGDLNAAYRNLVMVGFMTEAYFGTSPIDVGFELVRRMREAGDDSLRIGIRCDQITAALLAMSGDEDRFDEMVARVVRAYADLGDPEGANLQNQAWPECLWRLGRDTEAIATLRDAKASLDARNETGNNSTITALLATYLAEAGELDEAATMTEAARVMSSTDDFGALVPIGWAAGLIASARADHDTALAALDEALALVRQTDYLNFHADTLRIRGQVLWAAGRRDEAEAAFDEARGMWEHKGNVASIQRMEAWRESA